MYEFKPVTDRIARMRDKVRDRLIIADSEKLRIKAEATAKYRNFPPVIKKPMESLYVISNMPMDIEEDEYFVGDLGGKNWGGSSGRMWLSADIEHTWPIEAEALNHAPDDDPLYSHQKLAVSPEELKKLREITAEQAREFGGIRPEQWLPDGAEQLFSLQACTYGRPGGFPVLMMPGHLTPGFQTILKRGYGDIRKQAQDWLDERQGNVMGDDMDKYLFYKAATVACDGAITLTRRYAKIAAEKAKTAPTPERAAELSRMAESLEWIAEKPARTFWEACQQVMLYHVFLMVDNGPGVTSMGRFDQHVWPYLKKELDEGTITMEYAQELVDAFFLKLNIFFGGGFGKQAQTAGIGHIGQHTTIGGCIPETGEDATNPVSYMVHESIARLQLPEPTVSLRTSSKTPDGIWNAALATSMRVGGLPLLQNDEVIIPGIIRELGFSLEDARNYAFIG
ncbi:MAG: pyruvate formate lyase family protein, partial [Oscillospiraceae bacterium]|nr:pyruvate formate lyase family protein [Oscillospiraceae bacterium]